MGAFYELPSFLGKPLNVIAKELNYSKPNILILEGNEEELKKTYPEVWKNLASCAHNRDSRTNLEYAQDLVASWIFEDYIMNEINKEGMTIEHAGADKERQILPGKKVSASSDSKVSYNGTSRLLEIMTDYTGFWQRTKKVDLRDSKFTKMETSKSLFLGFSTKDKKYFLLNFNKKVEAKYIRSHYPYGGKPAYEITLTSADLKNYDIKDLIKEIKANI